MGDVFELRPIGKEVETTTPGKFLFVGRGIDREALKRNLEGLINHSHNHVGI